ncbi:MAG: tetratricopeptide repeat protein, partial [Verrucomicrobiota bacterium]
RTTVAPPPAEPPPKAAPARQTQPQLAVAAPQPRIPVTEPQQVKAVDTKPPPPTTRPPAPKEEERGFFQRINPMNLFRSDNKPKPATSLTVPPAPTPEVPPTNSPGAPSAVTPLPPHPAPLRYKYLSPPKPSPGNRAEADRLFEGGLEAHRTRKFPAAIEAYRAATRADASFYEAQYNLGLAAYEAGQLELALVAYELALAIKPNATNARYNFALALQKANYVRDAAHELDKVLTASPDEARAHLTLANIYAQQLFDKARAREHYQKVLQLEPHHAQAQAIRYWLAANP